ncbi:hypothetical protein GGI07_004291 [Coemansia sp. Benny D115]|nr:hypothetical protein GGI07_004291 [Coemansia sp. Benny D115]
MRYALRTRQAILVAVGTAYVLVLAWFNRQPIPTTSLIHETNNTLALRTTGTSYLGSHNRDSHWIEPAAYLQPEKSSNDSQIAPGAIDIDAGLLHIRIHSEFSTGRKGQPLGGLLKAYRKSLGFLGKQKTPETQWELLFVKRFPGPVRHAYLDRTRMRRADGSYEPRRLAVLYYTLQNESIEYGVRIYNIDDMVSSETGSRFTDPGPCPDDNRAAADKVYSNPVFKHCIGHSEKVMSHIDIHIPGALDVLEFSLRGDTLVYSRLNDVVRFRMLHVPSGVQTLGPYVIEHMRDVGSQSFLAQLHSTRPGNSVDVFLAHGHIVSDTFYFSFGLMQNSTRSNSWINKDVKRYRLTVHQQFSGLSRDELRLVNDAPLVDQAGLTSVFYFKATDVIVAIDTEWFRDAGSSSITQLQRVRESRPPYISTLNSPVAVNLTLDDSGALLAMTTVDDELFVFSRARASTTKRILDYRRYFSNINLSFISFWSFAFMAVG